jgi:hypothetical protein
MAIAAETSCSLGNIHPTQSRNAQAVRSQPFRSAYFCEVIRLTAKAVPFSNFAAPGPKSHPCSPMQDCITDSTALREYRPQIDLGGARLVIHERIQDLQAFLD